MIDSASISRKITFRLIYPFLFLIFLNSLDRVNIGFAAIRMNADLGLTPEAYGFGVGLFFVGYMVFQVPSMWLLHKLGMRKWMTAVILSWGLVATSMAFVHDATSFFILRFLLGMAEAGFAPGITYCCTIWMPKRFRAGAISKTMLAIPISVILGGPLSGWLMDTINPWGIEGWRWMIFIEGIPTLILGVASWWYFVDRPDHAKWLTPEEQAWLKEEINHEKQLQLVAKPEEADAKTALLKLLVTRQFWIFALIWFGLLTGSYGLIYWLPLVIKQVSTHSNLMISVFSALPWIGIGIGMVVNANHSDKKQERHLHVALPALLAAAGLTLATMFGTNALALVLLVIGGYGIGASQGTFWTLPTSLIPAAILPIGIALINMAGNLGGVFGPWMIGLVRQRTGSFDLPVYCIAAILVMAALAVLLIRPRAKH